MQNQINQFMTQLAAQPAVVTEQLAALANGRNPADIGPDLFALHDWLEFVSIELSAVFTAVDQSLMEMQADYSQWKTAVS